MTSKATRQTDEIPAAHGSSNTASSRTEREKRWLLENAESIRLENEYIEKNGLTLEGYRLF